MSFIPNFSAGQSKSSTNLITLTDTSTGSDGTIAKRRITILQSDGTYLVPAGTNTNYIEWALADSTITLDVLNQATAPTITVTWLDSSNDVKYTAIISFAFSAQLQNFLYGLSDGQVPITNPSLALSTDYYQNKVQFYCYMISGDQAINWASDIQKAQINYDNATAMIANQKYYF